ncbi:unnamed protein product [Trifolium pratense]|uniref:Uncharacterized protein n=1 Tax=Trifolium pratense TaxID=57577 RepID=A0ACB0KSH7_TRIPR|nr:unnamed protein product [Trifolium pratense]
MLLQYERATMNIQTQLLEALHKLWKNDIPSKVGIFGWRLLLMIPPTRVSLASKGILTNSHDLSCVFCFIDDDDCTHIFFSCTFVKQVWNRISNWLGIQLDYEDERLETFAFIW